MKRIASTVFACLCLVAACGSSGPTDQHASARPSREPTPTAAPATARPESSALADLPRPKASLAPGRYTKAAFEPRVGFTIGEGWSAQQVARGFFDIQRDPDTPGVVAVQFANVNSASLQDAIDAVTNRVNVRVVEAGEAVVDGRRGFKALIETTDPADTQPPVFRPVLDTTAGPISIASGRRLLITLVETTDGVLGILIGGSIAQWQDALDLGMPVVESVTIDE